LFFVIILLCTLEYVKKEVEKMVFSDIFFHVLDSQSILLFQN